EKPARGRVRTWFERLIQESGKGRKCGGDAPPEAGHPIHHALKVRQVAGPGMPLGVKGVDWNEQTPGAAVLDGEVRPFWCGNHECTVAVDLSLVISEVKPPPAELPVPGDHHRLYHAFTQLFFSLRQCLR